MVEAGRGASLIFVGVVVSNTANTGVVLLQIVVGLDKQVNQAFIFITWNI